MCHVESKRKYKSCVTSCVYFVHTQRGEMKKRNTSKTIEYLVWATAASNICVSNQSMKVRLSAKLHVNHHANTFICTEEKAIHGNLLPLSSVGNTKSTTTKKVCLIAIRASVSDNFREHVNQATN